MNINGQWLVKVPITSPVLRVMMYGLGRNVKHIQGPNGYNHSENIGDWGNFAVYHEGDDKYKLLYNGAPIVDKIKKVNDRLLSGEFHLGNKFIGRFTMERI